jgi:hypothetical protein
MEDTPKPQERGRRPMVYFEKGERVRVRHQVDAPQAMIVKDVPKYKDLTEGRNALLGITCYWFTKEHDYREETFDSRDLEKLDQDRPRERRSEK